MTTWCSDLWLLAIKRSNSANADQINAQNQKIWKIRFHRFFRTEGKQYNIF